MSSYLIRQNGGGAQGPFEEERVRGYIAQGKVRAGMEISADGRTWVPVERHPLFAAAPSVRAVSGPPPVRAAQPVEEVEEVEEISAAPARPDRRPARRPRAAPASGGGGKAALAVVGILVVGGIAVMASKGGSKEADPSGPAPSRSVASAPPVVEPPSPPPPVPTVATKREFRKRWEKYWEERPEIGWRQPGIYGKTIEDAEAVLSAACSGRKPDRTQTISGTHYWYFTCADGVIQLTWSYWGDSSGVRLNVDQLNDY